MIGKGKIDLKSEIWTLGVVFFVILFGRFPFADLEEIQDHTLKNKFSLRRLLRAKEIIDLNNLKASQSQTKELFLMITQYYEVLERFFSKIFEFVQINRMSFIDLCSDPIFQSNIVNQHKMTLIFLIVGKVYTFVKEKEIYQNLGTDTFKIEKVRKRQIDNEENADDWIEESVGDKKLIYDMELEGAKKGIEFKNQKQPSLISNNHLFN